MTGGEMGVYLAGFKLACFVSPCWGELEGGAYASLKNKLKKKKKSQNDDCLSQGHNNLVTQKTILLFYSERNENNFNEIMIGNRWQRASN